MNMGKYIACCGFNCLGYDKIESCSIIRDGHQKVPDTFGNFESLN
jgi:hypothetical protein